MKTNYKSVTGEDDFWKISACLHLANNADPESKTNKLHKIETFHQMFETLWQRFYVLNCDLTIDEAIIPYSGRLSFLQFIKGKPTRWGIKAFLLASSNTGYVYRMKIYAGKEKEKSRIKGLVENMLQNLEENAHIVYSTGINF